MNRVNSDGRLRCPLFSLVDPQELYELSIVLRAWIPPLEPNDQRLARMAEFFGLPLQYEPVRICKSMDSQHTHAARITGFLCLGANLEVEAEAYRRATQVVFDLYLEMEFTTLDLLLEPKCTGHSCLLL